jgi:hypothetical protein
MPNLGTCNKEEVKEKSIRSFSANMPELAVTMTKLQMNNSEQAMAFLRQPAEVRNFENI